jgi:hypothetical protein
MREHTDDLMHRNPGSADACLAMTDLWAYGNSVIHIATVAHRPYRLKPILPQIQSKVATRQKSALWSALQGLNLRVSPGTTPQDSQIENKKEPDTYHDCTRII